MTITMLRLNEPDAEVLPSDELGALHDFAAVAPHALPGVVSGFTGPARTFTGSHACQAVDRVPGATLATRDISIQVLLQWDFAAQAALGTPGIVYTRGLGGSVAEYVAAALELRVVHAALRIGEVRMRWQTTAGLDVVPAGAFFEVPADGYIMLTATRKWYTPTRVALRFYAGDRFLGDVYAAGDIGGATTGTTQIGAKGTAPYHYFRGAIDELRVVRGELAPEEVAATWQRISKAQPDGYRTLRDALPPRLPISGDPDSRVQRFLRVLGHGLGFASAQDDNFRDNFVPSRAYGEVLAGWEQATKETPKPLDDLAKRRDRVLSHLGQHEGSSLPGVTNALADDLAVAPSQLQVLAFSNRLDDAFAQASRWCTTPVADWTLTGGAAACNVGAALYQYEARSWKTCLVPALGNGAGHLAQVIVDYDTIPANTEAGLVIADFAKGNLLMLGLRAGGTVYTELWIEGQLYATQLRETLVAPAGGYALKIGEKQLDAPVHERPKSAVTTYAVGWQPVSAGEIVATKFEEDLFTGYQWVGVYVRSVGGNSSAGVVEFDRWESLAGLGQRPNVWYVYRDPALPGEPDYITAQRTLDRLRQSHTIARVCRATTALCDHANTGCDQTPMGAI